MEKTTQITIASTVFSLTESAYAKLAAYLERLQKHFANEAEGAEIIRDIESRIAEKLLHKKDSIITETDITALVAEIGEGSEFEDEREPDESAAASYKKLYRDVDNAIVGGVCSGIAAYFDIDVWIPRLLFLFSIFFGGLGIMLYIILWILIPAAKSTSQKLEMRGHAVTLESISRTVREGVEEARTSGALRKTRISIQHFIAGILRLAGRVLGMVLSTGSFFALIGLAIGFGIVTVNWNAPWNDFPLRGVVSETLLFSGLVAGSIAIFIPLAFVFMLGIRLAIRKKIVLPSAIGFGLIGIWALAISAAGTITVTAAGQYFEFTRTDPSYQYETRSLDIEPFGSIRTDHNITIEEGDAQRVEVYGRAMDQDQVRIEVRDGVLMITENEEGDDVCTLFCSSTPPRVTVTTPGLETVAVESASVRFDEFTDTELAIELQNANMRGTLSVDSLDLIAAYSRVDHITGEAQNATIELTDVNFYTGSFIIENAELSTTRSFGEIHVTDTLTTLKNIDSRITNEGDRDTQTP